MLRTLFVFVLLLAITERNFAQVRATTESGNKVLLFDNGTWKYEENATVQAETTAAVAEVAAVAAIAIDTTRIFATVPEQLFYLPSPRLVKYFGESGGKIRCKMNCSNSLGIVKVHFMWEFPVIDPERYFGWFGEGTLVTFTMEGGQTVEIVMGDEATSKKIDKRNYSMISNASLPLTQTQISALLARPLRKMSVGWKKSAEDYEVEEVNLLMEALPTVF